MVALFSRDSHVLELELEVYNLLNRITNLMDMYHRDDLRSEDLTIPQFTILNYATVNGISLSEISAHMLCDISNLTGIVDRLVAKGLVERRQAPRDRRSSLICLTAAGEEKLQQVQPQYLTKLRQRMSALSLPELLQLHDLLQALYKGIHVCSPANR